MDNIDYVNVYVVYIIQSQLLGTLFANLGTRPETLTLSRVHCAIDNTIISLLSTIAQRVKFALLCFHLYVDTACA